MVGARDPRELVESATRGDERALDELLGRYLPGLRAFMRRHAGDPVLRKESSSDLAQSVCSEVLRDLARGQFEYRGEAEFRRWLYQAAELKLQNRRRFYRAQKRDVAREQTAAPAREDPGPVPSDLLTPSRAAAGREEVDRVQRAFEQLGERAQEVIRLARFEGLGHDEIGRRLGLSAAHSRMLLSRALARLSTLAGGDPAEDGG